MLGIALIALTIACLALAALAALQLLPLALWVLAVVVGAATSLTRLILFFHPWLVVGLVIDVALLWGVLIAGWTPAGD